MTEMEHLVARLRGEAEERRRLDLPMTVKPREILALLDELATLRAAAPRPTRRKAGA